jgi:hypothetical protein
MNFFRIRFKSQYLEQMFSNISQRMGLDAIPPSLSPLLSKLVEFYDPLISMYGNRLLGIKRGSEGGREGGERKVGEKIPLWFSVFAPLGFRLSVFVSGFASRTLPLAGFAYRIFASQFAEFRRVDSRL